MTQIILASQSPRRRELLKILGLNFKQVSAHVYEDIITGEDPVQTVQRLAQLKAGAVAGKVQEGLVIAADTIVVCENKILAKPVDENDAYNMLSLLNGRSHQVVTGLCVLNSADGQKQVDFETTRVFFRQMEDEEIWNYIKSHEPFDKAGAYAIQGLGSVFVERLEGCYFNVVGLPVARLYQMLKSFGVKLLGVQDTE